MREAGIINPTEQSLATIVVLPYGEEQLPAALESAAQLRRAGHNVVTNTESTDLGKRLKYVDKIGSRYAVVIGAKEVASATLSIKDMHSGDTRQATLDEFIDELAKS